MRGSTPTLTPSASTSPQSEEKKAESAHKSYVYTMHPNQRIIQDFIHDFVTESVVELQHIQQVARGNEKNRSDQSKERAALNALIKLGALTLSLMPLPVPGVTLGALCGAKLVKEMLQHLDQERTVEKRLEQLQSYRAQLDQLYQSYEEDNGKIRDIDDVEQKIEEMHDKIEALSPEDITTESNYFLDPILFSLAAERVGRAFAYRYEDKIIRQYDTRGARLSLSRYMARAFVKEQMVSEFSSSMDINVALESVFDIDNLSKKLFGKFRMKLRAQFFPETIKSKQFGPLKVFKTLDNPLFYKSVFEFKSDSTTPTVNTTYYFNSTTERQEHTILKHNKSEDEHLIVRGLARLAVEDKTLTHVDRSINHTFVDITNKLKPNWLDKQIQLGSHFITRRQIIDDAIQRPVFHSINQADLLAYLALRDESIPNKNLFKIQPIEPFAEFIRKRYRLACTPIPVCHEDASVNAELRDLRYCDFTGVDFSGMKFPSECNVGGTLFCQAYLFGVNLEKMHNGPGNPCNFHGANLAFANMSGVELMGCNWAEVTFDQANIEDGKLTDIETAGFSDAIYRAHRNEHTEISSLDHAISFQLNNLDAKIQGEIKQQRQHIMRNEKKYLEAVERIDGYYQTVEKRYQGLREGLESKLNAQVQVTQKKLQELQDEFKLHLSDETKITERHIQTVSENFDTKLDDQVQHVKQHMQSMQETLEMQIKKNADGAEGQLQKLQSRVNSLKTQLEKTKQETEEALQKRYSELEKRFTAQINEDESQLQELHDKLEADLHTQLKLKDRFGAFEKAQRQINARIEEAIKKLDNKVNGIELDTKRLREHQTSTSECLANTNKQLAILFEEKQQNQIEASEYRKKLKAKYLNEAKMNLIGQEEQIPITEETFINLTLAKNSLHKESAIPVEMPVEDKSQINTLDLGRANTLHDSHFIQTQKFELHDLWKPIRVEVSATGSRESNLQYDLESKTEAKAKTIIFPTPRRIVIEGNAGVGKTTLSRYLGYLYANDKLWTEKKFDWVFIISLHELLDTKFYPADRDYTIADIVLAQCFGHPPAHTSSQLREQLISQLGLNCLDNTLLIADGFDEIYDYATRVPRMKNAIEALISRPNLVITGGRQSISHLVKAQDTRHLVIDGLSDSQILQYIDWYFNEKNNEVEEKVLEKKAVPAAKLSGVEFSHFLQQPQNNKAWQIAHIPLHLSILCHTWQHLSAIAETWKTPTNLVKLYSAMVVSLSASCLKKQGVDRSQLEQKHIIMNNDFIRQTHSFLAALSCQAMESPGSYELSQTLIDQVAARFSHAPSCLQLQQTGFVKWKNKHKRDLEFIHLTFKEYFTAKYISDLYVTHHLKTEKPYQDILNRFATNPSWTMVWYFVTGLLTESSQDLAVSFLLELVKATRDELGIYSIKLLGQCIKESGLAETDTPSLALKTLFQQIDNGLVHWVEAGSRIMRERDNIYSPSLNCFISNQIESIYSSLFLTMNLGRAFHHNKYANTCLNLISYKESIPEIKKNRFLIKVLGTLPHDKFNKPVVNILLQGTKTERYFICCLEALRNTPPERVTYRLIKELLSYVNKHKDKYYSEYLLKTLNSLHYSSVEQSDIHRICQLGSSKQISYSTHKAILMILGCLPNEKIDHIVMSRLVSYFDDKKISHIAIEPFQKVIPYVAQNSFFNIISRGSLLAKRTIIDTLTGTLVNSNLREMAFNILSYLPLKEFDMSMIDLIIIALDNYNDKLYARKIIIELAKFGSVNLYNKIIQIITNHNKDMERSPISTSVLNLLSEFPKNFFTKELIYKLIALNEYNCISEVERALVSAANKNVIEVKNILLNVIADNSLDTSIQCLILEILINLPIHQFDESVTMIISKYIKMGNWVSFNLLNTFEFLPDEKYSLDLCNAIIDISSGTDNGFHLHVIPILGFFPSQFINSHVIDLLAKYLDYENDSTFILHALKAILRMPSDKICHAIFNKVMALYKKQKDLVIFATNDAINSYRIKEFNLLLKTIIIDIIKNDSSCALFVMRQIFNKLLFNKISFDLDQEIIEGILNVHINSHCGKAREISLALLSKYTEMNPSNLSQVYDKIYNSTSNSYIHGVINELKKLLPISMRNGRKITSTGWAQKKISINELFQKYFSSSIRWYSTSSQFSLLKDIVFRLLLQEKSVVIDIPSQNIRFVENGIACSLKIPKEHPHFLYCFKKISKQILPSLDLSPEQRVLQESRTHNPHAFYRPTDLTSQRQSSEESTLSLTT